MKERFFRNRTAVFTVVFVLLVGLVGILAPVIAPNDPYETNILNKFASYSLQYPLGTAHARNSPNIFSERVRGVIASML